VAIAAIGLASAKRLHEEGAKVLISGRNTKALVCYALA
jgi:short-subunit dehydrogenase involved in D-alanine esterification of teichoic acids